MKTTENQEMEFNKIKNIFDVDEKVLLCGRQSRLRPGGSITTPNSIFLTSKRVIIRNPTMLGLRASIEDYPYQNITGVKIQKGLFSSMIYLTIPGRTEVSRVRGKKGASLLKWGRKDEAELAALPHNEAQEVLNIIKEAITDMNKRREENRIIPEMKDENVLKILKIRYAKGEITKEEFEDMKKNLT